MNEGYERAVRLTDEGRAHLKASRLEEAERCFQAATRAYPLPAAFNNWAMCRYQAEDHEAALAILASPLRTQAPRPYSRALASMVLAALGRRGQALEMLGKAVSDFERGLRDPSLREDASEENWQEYSLILKQAAGKLCEHRLVLDLHARWPGQGSPHDAYMAGVAAFNLRRYAQAARHWHRAAAGEFRQLAEAFARVAEVMEQGFVPHFELEYDPSYPRELAQTKDLQAQERLMGYGRFRMLFLAHLFDPATENSGDLVSGMVEFGGDWGVALGRLLLQANRLPMEIKLGVARGLIQRGVYRENEPIPIMHQGKPDSVIIRKVEVTEADPALEQRLQEALRLRESGRKDEAYRMLLEMWEGGIAYPPAIMALANLMRQRGELDSAQSLLESLEKLYPEHPPVLINLCGLWLQKGDTGRARQYFARIKQRELSPEQRRTVDRLAAYLLAPPDISELGEMYRAEIEERRISTDVTLRAALKQVPVQWLNAAASLLQAPPARLRQDRAKGLERVLTTREGLARALSGLPPQARKALRYLLQEGGWAKLAPLARRFGAMDGDGFWWDETPPTSNLGQLRLRGLVFVGRAAVNGRRHKVAVVPVELRPLLMQLLR